MTDIITPQAGWYPDPTDSRAYRWWSGGAWTDHLTAAPSAESVWSSDATGQQLAIGADAFQLSDQAASPFSSSFEQSWGDGVVDTRIGHESFGHRRDRHRTDRGRRLPRIDGAELHHDHPARARCYRADLRGARLPQGSGHGRRARDLAPRGSPVRARRPCSPSSRWFRCCSACPARRKSTRSMRPSLTPFRSTARSRSSSSATPRRTSARPRLLPHAPRMHFPPRQAPSAAPRPWPMDRPRILNVTVTDDTGAFTAVVAAG